MIGRFLRYTLALLAMSVSLLSGAETVSQRDAKRIAAKFFNAACGQVMAEPRFVYNGKKLTTDRLFSPFYVYNCPAGGFVIISAENKAFPILGYSLTESFDPEHIGESTTALLKLYASHIENIRYDSQVPVEAIAAWQNIPEYIYAILTASYDATYADYTVEEALARLEAVADSEDADASASVLYSPDQWIELVETERRSAKTLPLGIVSPEGITPMILYGRKGDYFRLSLDGPNNQFWRLLPTEIISGGEMAVFGNPPIIEEEIAEERPFEFYDSFIAETRREREADRSSIEEALVVREPRVCWHGLGHYSVTLPEEVESVTVYSLDGAKVFADKFRDTTVANFNLSELPSGFYFAVMAGRSGTLYSIKLFR